MKAKEEIGNLITLENEELRKRFKSSKTDTSTLKSAFKYYETLSDSSLSLREMAEKENLTLQYICQLRRKLVEYGFLEIQKKKPTAGNVKKLMTQKQQEKIEYKFATFNLTDLEEASLNPKKDYYYFVKSGNKKITLCFFESKKEAIECKESKKSKY